MMKDLGEYTTKAKADEIYDEEHSFEVDGMNGVELEVAVYDSSKLGQHTVSASFTGVRAHDPKSMELLLGTCDDVKLENHGIGADPKGIKIPLKNTFNSAGAHIYLTFTLNE
mmetsp:Transcript_6650/g.14552  ORF Transcript_6650/g.14552 Transcript_6650/m.14552 type:complete len:112 (-) Transcript_6650:396-731(-)